MEDWRCTSTILHLSTTWKWAVSFIPRPFYPRRKIPRYLFDRMLRGPQSRSRCSEVQNNLSLVGNQTLAVQRIAHQYTDWAIYRLIEVPERNIKQNPNVPLKSLPQRCILITCGLFIDAFNSSETSNDKMINKQHNYKNYIRNRKVR
jgi:hypothetical protein